MSKIFRRPMFRKGGNVGDGIMTGIVDREQYQIGTDPFVGRTIPSLKDLAAESTEALLEAAGDRGGFDPLTSLLLSYGPAAAIENRGGGTLANLVAAGEKPIANLLKEKAEEDKFQRGLKTRATASAIEKRDKMIETEEERKFKTNLFTKETDRLMNLQQNDFSNEAKILGLKQEFTGDQAQTERDLKLNLQKIENALRSNLANEEQENKMIILQKQYENALGILKAEQAGESGIDSTIKKAAQKSVEEGNVGTYSEALNTETWRYKTSGELMEKGYLVSDEFLNETDDLEKKAKRLAKKPNNEGRIFYSPKVNKYYILEGKTFKPFQISGTENIIENNGGADNVVKQVEGITNYEYDTGEKRDQTKDIRQQISQMKGPANNPNPTYDTSMTQDQKSAYERYLSDYRNR
tara:strand:+ start:963 stop:2189 length:1227 start_codon:yes stop_codon:yes gene_type:complete